jgi:hypothetical protein
MSPITSNIGHARWRPRDPTKAMPALSAKLSS